MSDEAAVPFPEGKFGVIYADPPWFYRTYSRQPLELPEEGRPERSRRPPYDLMDHASICSLPVGTLAAKDCLLFCWATAPNLGEAIQVIEAWGFEYKTVAFTWVKTYANGRPICGLGYWTRSASEFCLLATRGNPKRIDRSVRQVIISERRGHSQKPDEAYESIERLVAGPYIELFARQRRPGWEAWGNQLQDPP